MRPDHRPDERTLDPGPQHVALNWRAQADLVLVATGSAVAIRAVRRSSSDFRITVSQLRAIRG